MQFESLDLYVLTFDNDTIIYKSEKSTSSMYLISIDDIIKIKAFWCVLSNGITTEKYIVKSRKSNAFELYVYGEPIYRKQIIRIRDDMLIFEGQQQEFNKVKQTHHEIEKYVHNRPYK